VKETPLRAWIKIVAVYNCVRTRDTLDEVQTRCKKNQLADFIIYWPLLVFGSAWIGREQRAAAIFGGRYAIHSFEISDEVTVVT